MVKHIINTHAHPDHVSGNMQIIKESGADVMIQRTDLKGVPLKALMTSIKNKIFALPHDMKIYLGHYYGIRPFFMIAEQKRMYGM